MWRVCVLLPSIVLGCICIGGLAVFSVVPFVIVALGAAVCVLGAVIQSFGDGVDAGGVQVARLALLLSSEIRRASERLSSRMCKSN